MILLFNYLLKLIAVKTNGTLATALFAGSLATVAGSAVSYSHERNEYRQGWGSQVFSG
jgi:hypothetical protein